MAPQKKTWTDFDSSYLYVAKDVATKPLPLHYGPYSHAEALQWRNNFYHFRKALFASLPGYPPDSYPVRLYAILMTVVVGVPKVPTYGPMAMDWEVILNLDPIIKTADRLDPERLQERMRMQAKFIEDQRIPESAYASLTLDHKD